MLILLFERQVDVLTSLQGKLPEYKPVAAKTDTGKGYQLTLHQTHVDYLKVKHEGNAPGRLTLDDSHVDFMELTAANDTGTGVVAVGGNAGTVIHEAEQKLKGVKVNVERMRFDAGQTHRMVRDLK